MIDMRKPKERRRGEIHGPFSWGTVLNAFVMILIFMALGYISFGFGRHYESVKDHNVFDPATYKEYKTFRIQGNH